MQVASGYGIGRNIGPRERMKRNLERSKRLDSSPERLSTRRRKAEVIDAGIPFPSLWRNRVPVKGSRKLDGGGSWGGRIENEKAAIYTSKPRLNASPPFLPKREEDTHTHTHTHRHWESI